MTNFALLIVGTAFLLSLVYLLVLAIRGKFKYRGKMMVTCPETRQPVAVKVDGKSAAVSAMMGENSLHLRDCTRWPERHDCGQECLAELAESPEACMVVNILANWYRGKSCVYCHKPFETIHWHDHKPGLRSPEGKLIEWHETAIEELPEIFQTHSAVCWNCCIAESFRTRHPELVTDRIAPPVH